MIISPYDLIDCLGNMFYRSFRHVIIINTKKTSFIAFILQCFDYSQTYYCLIQFLYDDTPCISNSISVLRPHNLWHNSHCLDAYCGRISRPNFGRKILLNIFWNIFIRKYNVSTYYIAILLSIYLNNL